LLGPPSTEECGGAVQQGLDAAHEPA
jgi:hypothetical protein